MSGERDQAEGTWDKTKGKVKEAAGNMTNDDDLQAEGKKEQAKGTAEKAMGHVKEAGENVKEGVRDAID